MGDYNILPLVLKKINKMYMCIYVFAYTGIYLCEDVNKELTLFTCMKNIQMAEKHWFKGNFYCLSFYSF